MTTEPAPAQRLMDLATAHLRGRVVCTAARLGVADELGAGPKTVGELAHTCAVDESSLRRLLRAVASIGIVSEIEPDRFELTPLGQPLQKDAPDSVWAYVVFWADLLADSWSHLTESVRTGTPAAVVMKGAGIESRWVKEPDPGAIFRAVMGTGPSADYASIATAYDFGRHRVVADLGGGGGTLVHAVLEQYADVQGMLVDRQAAVDESAAHFPRALVERCSFVGADLLEAVPAGADLLVLKHVLHGFDDDHVITVLRNCRNVSGADDRLLVIEYVLPAVIDHADRELETRLISDLNMMLVTGGRERTEREWHALLAAAGFSLQRVIGVEREAFSIVEATPI